MKDLLFAAWFGLTPIGLFFYILFFGYPSDLFAGLVTGIMIGIMGAMCYVWRKENRKH